MTDDGRLFAGLGAVLGGLSVVAGAFGAHALRDSLSADHFATFETAARYQMYHALALMAAAAAPDGRAMWWARRLLLAGVFLFSGSLYSLVLMKASAFGAVTPFGGALMIAGWVGVAIGWLRVARP